MKKYLAVAVALSFVASAQAASGYSLSLLRPLNGLSSYGIDVNDAGQVIARSQLQDDYLSQRATLWTGSTFVDVASLAGVASGYSYPGGINNYGQIVGTLPSTLFGGNPSKAVVWNGASATDLGALGTEPNVTSGAYDINDSAQIVGISYLSVGGQSTHAVMWSGGVIKDLGTAGGTSSAAYAINSGGEVVGTKSTGNVTQAVRWSGDSFTVLPGIGGAFGVASGINDPGQVAGWSLTAQGQARATIWNANSPTDLGTLGGNTSYGEDINDIGQVVGSSYKTNGGEQLAVLWESGSIIDLNMFALGSGWTLVSANAISDTGFITGVATNSSLPGYSAFLLTPTDVSAVPIPAAAWLMISGIGALGVAARRRKAHVAA